MHHSQADGMDLIHTICSFIEEIGIRVQYRTLERPTFLPGIEIGAECIYIDLKKMLHPGDLLHEAGHLAVTPSERRWTDPDSAEPRSFPDQGEEIAAVLWSYAAATHLALPLKSVFHDGGYKGDADWLIDCFQAGQYIGLPLLEWMGLTLGEARAREAQKPAFPAMLCWVRA